MNITSSSSSNELLRTWQTHLKAVACVSACCHRSSQPLKIKCILLVLKKNILNIAVYFWLNLSHLLLRRILFFFLFFLTEHAGLECFLVFATVLAGFYVHPHLSFVKDVSSPNPYWRCSLTPLWAMMSVTSHWRQSHTPTRTTCPDFSEDWGPSGINSPSFYIIHVIFNALQNVFYHSLKIISQAYILVWSSVYHKFLFFSDIRFTHR